MFYDRKGKNKMEYNYKGVPLISSDMYVARKQIYLNEDDTPDWDNWIIHGDNDGFDTEIVLDNGTYIKEMILPEGTKIIRYGGDGGFFTSNPGTKYEELSLPNKVETVPYHEYIVVGYCPVKVCRVSFGYVAPGFEQCGGGVQYKHDQKIHECVRKGILKEDFKWLEMM